MTNLEYLCITSAAFFNGPLEPNKSPEERAKLIDEYLEPMKVIKIAGRGGGKGQFDFVTQGWRISHVLSPDLPFRVLFEEPPPGDRVKLRLPFGKPFGLCTWKPVSMPVS